MAPYLIDDKDRTPGSLVTAWTNHLATAGVCAGLSQARSARGARESTGGQPSTTFPSGVRGTTNHLRRRGAQVPFAPMPR